MANTRSQPRPQVHLARDKGADRDAIAVAMARFIQTGGTVERMSLASMIERRELTARANDSNHWD